MKSLVSNFKFCLFLSFAVFVFAGSLFAQESDSAENELLITADILFPKTACAYVSVRDISVLRESWKNTSLGELQETSQMQEFFKHMHEQLSDSFSAFQDILGVSLDDISEIASSEISAAVMLMDEERYGFSVVINIGDKEYETQAVLNRIAERVEEKGGSLQKQKITGAEIYILDIVNSKTQKLHKAYYVLKDEFLIVSDKPEIIKDILVRWTAVKNNPDESVGSFSEEEEYFKILENTMVDGMLPDVIWYVDPISFIKFRRLMNIEDDPEYAERRDLADLLTKAGFDGIKSVGGVAAFDQLGFDLNHRVFISIPEEPQGSLKMLAFDKKGDKTLPAWITDQVGAVHVLNIDLLTLFDNLGPLVNQFFGEGSDTVWDDVLDGFENDPYGPQLNLRDEIFNLCENKIVILHQNLDPKAIDGARCLIAVPAKDPELLKENLGLLLNEEPSFEVLENGDDIRWKLHDEEHAEGSAGSEVKGKRFPELTITIWNDYLLIASEPDFIDIIQAYDENGSKPLVDCPQFKLVESEAKKMAGSNQMVSFLYTNSEMLREHTYEMIKAGMLAESVSSHSSILGDFIRSNTKRLEERRDSIDVSKLPEYSEVKSYFMPGFGFIYETEGGFIYQGARMSKEKMGAVNSDAASANAPKTKKVKKVKKVKKD